MSLYTPEKDVDETRACGPETRANDEPELIRQQTRADVGEEEGRERGRSLSEGWIEHNGEGVEHSGGEMDTMGANTMMLMDGLSRRGKEEKEERRRARVTRR